MIRETPRLVEVHPNLIRRSYGDWLAASPHGACVSLGVTGATEQEARKNFETAIKRWFAIISDTGANTDA
jgi:hypothetical protein